MIVAATGHRPPKFTQTKPYIAWVDAAGAALQRMQPEKVIVGMAVGFDTAVAEACVLLKLPFIAAVPFKYQYSMWPAAAQRVYHLLLGIASEVHVLYGEDYEPWKMHARNKWMMDRADEVLAAYDGSPKGGTANAIAYAQKKGLPVTNLWP